MNHVFEIIIPDWCNVIDLMQFRNFCMFILSSFKLHILHTYFDDKKESNSLNILLLLLASWVDFKLFESLDCFGLVFFTSILTLLLPLVYHHGAFILCTYDATYYFGLVHAVLLYDLVGVDWSFCSPYGIDFFLLWEGGNLSGLSFFSLHLLTHLSFPCVHPFVSSLTVCKYIHISIYPLISTMFYIHLFYIYLPHLLTSSLSLYL
jgi:hypothetical protein